MRRKGGAGHLRLYLGGALVFLAVVLVGFVMLPGLLSKGGYSLREERAPRLPDGYSLASAYYRLDTAKIGGGIIIEVPLADRPGVLRGLGLYTYRGGKWQRLGDVTLSKDGLRAIAQVPSPPATLAVLRRGAAGFQVMGTVSDGESVSPQAAPLINVLNVVAYQPQPDGSLTGGPVHLQENRTYDVVPVVTSGIGPSNAVNAILSNPNSIQAHIKALVSLVVQGKYDGIEIDYLSVQPEQRSQFTKFVQELAAGLHQQQKTLTVMLPLPRREGAQWNDLGYDWQQIGQAADFVKLAPERDMSVYRTRMPEVLKYVAGLVDPKRLVLVVSPKATEKSAQGLTFLSRTDALGVAAQVSVKDANNLAVNQTTTITADNLNRQAQLVGMVWDPATAMVMFSYRQGGETHTVWIENRFSIGFKLQMAQLFHLGGVSVEDASASPSNADLWPSLQEFVATGKTVLLQPNPAMLRPDFEVSAGQLDKTNARAGVVQWKTPDRPGRVQVTLIVSDGDIRVSRTITVNVTAVPSPTPTPTASAAR